MSSPYPGEPRERSPFWQLLLASVVGAAIIASIIVAAFVFADRYGMNPLATKVETAPTVERPSLIPPQTEVFFLNGPKTRPVATDEWWAARADHRLIAPAVFICKKI